MPKITRNEEAPTRRKRAPAVILDDQGEEVRVSSILFGLAMLIAIVVATAAWMGGSMSQFESKFSNFLDDGARTMGIAVQDVSVYGLEQDPVLARDIKAAAMIEPGENMFRADPHLIQRRVEGTRKVLNVRVHRLWPDQIVILADAAEPVALWHDGQDWAVIDGLGRVVPMASAADYPGLIRLAGTGAPDAAPHFVKTLSQTDLAPQIAIATRIANRRWDLRIVGGTSVRLPEDEKLETALTRLSGLEKRTRLSQRDLSKIDLRNDGRVYLSPNTPTLPASAEAGAKQS
jgi:cell division protein FtsQ